MGGLAAALAALVLAAPEEVAPATVTGQGPPALFACRGRDAAMNAGARRSGGARMAGAMGNRAMSRMNRGMAGAGGRSKSNMEVLVDGRVVKIRPSEASGPLMGAKPADGWYQLEDVSITEDEVQGRAPWGAIASPRLLLQKAEGKVTFGAFSGRCRIRTETAEAAVDKES